MQHNKTGKNPVNKLYIKILYYPQCRGMDIDLGDTCLYMSHFADEQTIIANDKDDLD